MRTGEEGFIPGAYSTSRMMREYLIRVTGPPSFPGKVV